jgi:osmotically inducible lipoprotein OsmB
VFFSAAEWRRLLRNNKSKPRQEIMVKSKLALGALLTLTLAGCMQDPATRGLAGGAAGLVLADALDTNLATGAVIGGLAGVASCGIDVGLPACN